MTDNEAEVLSALAEHPGEARVRDLGGKDNSHHARTLVRAVERGWVVFETPAPRKGKRYEITPLGRSALANHLELERLARAR